MDTGTPETTTSPVLKLDVRAIRVARGRRGRLLAIVGARIRFPGTPETETLTFKASPGALRAVGVLGRRRFAMARWTRAGRGLEVLGALVAPGETPGRLSIYGLRVGLRGRPESVEPLYLAGVNAVQAAKAGARWSDDPIALDRAGEEGRGAVGESIRG